MFEFNNHLTVLIKIPLVVALFCLPLQAEKINPKIREHVENKKASLKYQKNNFRIGKKLSRALGYRKHHGKEKPGI